RTTDMVPGVVSNPVPAKVNVLELMATFAVLAVRGGVRNKFATCLGGPLVPPSVVTTAVSGPGTDGGGVKVTVNSVAEFTTTVPTALLDSCTVLVPTRSKPVPVMVMVGLVIDRCCAVVLAVTVGAATKVATCTAAPLLPPSVVITAVSFPTVVGRVV